MSNNSTPVDRELYKYQSAFRGSEKDRKEFERMMGLYTGFEKSQWSLDAKNKLLSRGSLLPQINLTKGKIKRLAGSIIKNYFDVQFIPVSTAETQMTRILNDIFVADSNMFDYDAAYLKCVINGLIHCGVEQMKLSTRYNVLGNIEFESVHPGHVLLDPHWITDDSWDLENVWKVAYLTPKQVVDTYGHRNAYIREQMRYTEMHGFEYRVGEENPSARYWNQDPSYNHKYRMIEHHFLETESKDVEFVRLEDDRKIEMPDSSVIDGIEFLEQMRVKDQVKNTFKRRIHQKVYKVNTICHDLDQNNFIDSGKADIQIGRLPFFPLSADRYGGTNAGIVMLLEDVQRLLNAREAASDDIIASSADGSYLVDPILFGNDRGKMAEAMKAMHVAGAKIETAPGMLSSGRELLKPIERQPYPGEFQYEVTRMEGYFDKLSGQTATLDGTKESAHDTGVLFARRAMMAEVALTTLTKNLEQHQRDKFESWYLYAKKVYAGPVRQFNKKDKNGSIETITINNRDMQRDGKVIINNDFSQLERHNVIITQSRDGLTNREIDKSRSIELLNVVTDPIKRVILEQQALEAVNTSNKQRAELQQYNDLSLSLQVLRMEAEAENLRATIDAARAQRTAMSQGMQPGTEGQPAEGEQPVQEDQIPVEETQQP